MVKTILEILTISGIIFLAIVFFVRLAGGVHDAIYPEDEDNETEEEDDVDVDKPKRRDEKTRKAEKVSAPQKPYRPKKADAIKKAEAEKIRRQANRPSQFHNGQHKKTVPPASVDPGYNRSFDDYNDGLQPIDDIF